MSSTKRTKKKIKNPFEEEAQAIAKEEAEEEELRLQQIDEEIKIQEQEEENDKVMMTIISEFEIYRKEMAVSIFDKLVGDDLLCFIAHLEENY